MSSNVRTNRFVPFATCLLMLLVAVANRAGSGAWAWPIIALIAVCCVFTARALVRARSRQ